MPNRSRQPGGRLSESPTFDCPRRREQYFGLRMTGAELADYIEVALDPVGHPVYRDDGSEIPPQDHWREHDPGVPTCSYCGSLRPDVFFAAVEAGAEIVPTDKSYKVYVCMPDPRAGAQRVISKTHRRESPGDGWVMADDEAYGELRDGDHCWVEYGPRPALMRAKFYTVHLNRDHAARLRILIDTGSLNIGYPGRFYNGLWLAPPKEIEA